MLHELQVHQVELDLQQEQIEQTRMELSASLDRYVSLFEHAPIGYCAVNVDGTLRDVNRACADLLGCTRDGLLGHRIESFVAADSRPGFSAMMRRLRTDAAMQVCDLDVGGNGAGGRRLRAQGCASPDGRSLFLALMDISGPPA